MIREQIEKTAGTGEHEQRKESTERRTEQGAESGSGERRNRIAETREQRVESEKDSRELKQEAGGIQEAKTAVPLLSVRCQSGLQRGAIPAAARAPGQQAAAPPGGTALRPTPPHRPDRYQVGAHRRKRALILSPRWIAASLGISTHVMHRANSEISHQCPL